MSDLPISGSQPPPTRQFSQQRQKKAEIDPFHVYLYLPLRFVTLGPDFDLFLTQRDPDEAYFDPILAYFDPILAYFDPNFPVKSSFWPIFLYNLQLFLYKLQLFSCKLQKFGFWFNNSEIRKIVNR